MPRPSDEKLSRALREEGLEELAQRAEAGEFNDYFGRHATPKMELVKVLHATGDHEALVARVGAGEFDSGKAEADEWYASPEGQEMRNLMEGMS